jgi:hypothetical protein
MQWQIATLPAPAADLRRGTLCARVKSFHLQLAQLPRVFLRPGRKRVSDRYRPEPGLIARFVAVDDRLDESDAL